MIGTIGLSTTGHHAGTIRKMFVKKEFRGKETGIAQELLCTLEPDYTDFKQCTGLAYAALAVDFPH